MTDRRTDRQPEKERGTENEVMNARKDHLYLDGKRLKTLSELITSGTNHLVAFVNFAVRLGFTHKVCSFDILSLQYVQQIG